MTADDLINLCARCHLCPHLVRNLEPMWLRPPLPTTSSPPARAPKEPIPRFCAIPSFGSGPIPASRRLCRVHFCYQSLSIAHCGRWTESIMGCFPGATWHHRSFTEGSYLEACALVLDWAGSLLTSGGRHIVLDAMAIKGLPRLESDFMRIEYIRHMNQGIHFNSGRIHALLALAHYNPRYSARISEAADDLIEMVDNYVLPDGGTLEGPGYWHYTFHSALQEFYLLARYFGKSLKEYASPALRKTGRFALAMHSLEGEGTQVIPVNDCHPGAAYQMGLVAAFCLLSDDTEWKRNYAVLLKRSEAQPDFFWLTIAPEVTDLPRKDLEPPEPLLDR